MCWSLFWRALLSPQDLRPALQTKRVLFSQVLIPVLGLSPGGFLHLSNTLAPDLEGNSLRYQSHGNTVVTSYLTCFLSPHFSHCLRPRLHPHHLHCPVIGKYSQHPDSGEPCTLAPCASSSWYCIQMGVFMNTHRPVVSLSSVSPPPLPSKSCS